MKLLRLPFLLFLFVLLAATGRERVSAQVFQWARVVHGAVDTAFVQPQASATDVAGNTYVAVNFTDSLRLGRLLLTGPRNWSMAVIKYDSSGAVVWAKPLADLQVVALAADNSAGGIFITARNRTAGTWDGSPVPISASTAFYAKCSAAGTLQWSRALPTLASYATLDIRLVADNAGAAYVAGTVRGNSTVGGTAVDSTQSFILKTDGAGTQQWVRVLHGTPTDPVYNFRLGPKPGGGCLVSGIVRATLYLGTGTGITLASSSGASGGFVSSFDAAGTHLWSQVLNNTNASSQAFTNINATAADAAGNTYVTGGTFGPLQIGSTALASGYFLVKYDATGTRQWVRGAQSPNVITYSDEGLLLAANSAGVNVVVSTIAQRSQARIVVGTLLLTAPFNVVHYTAQGLEQWTAADTWTGSVSAPAPYFSPRGLGIDGRGTLYTVGLPLPTYQTTPPVIQFGAQTAVGRGTIVVRLNTYANTLRGMVYYDLNGNGQQDPTEGPFPKPLTAALTQGTATIYSAVSTTGQLQAYALPGAYTLSLAQVPQYYTVSQPGSGSYAGTFSSSTQLVNGQDFGLAPIANQADVRATLTPYGMARPGFTTRYRLTVENVGTTTVASGTATVTLDGRMAYISSTPSASRTGQVLTWTYTGLAPFARLEYDVLFSLPTNTVVGTVLNTAAAAPLTADVAPADNTAALAQTVVGAYDPNSMDVNYERLTPAQITAQQPLDYTIHFQNLGTAAASTVVLSDTLDFRKLNLASLMLVAQSHSCIWSLTTAGPEKGLLTVRFLNINLPERNVDVIRSQGFVRFRVQPRATLAVGEIIPNHAGIVFDYNNPVITNTATTTVAQGTAVLARHDAPAWTAYPNPATDAISIAADLATAGPVGIELLDVLGRPLRRQLFTAPAGPLHQLVDLRGLAAGVYLLRLTPPTGPATSRRVVLH
ncbi:hypothetical protein ACVWYF_001574 [Hymenobacter sp. UYAg731]